MIGPDKGQGGKHLILPPDYKGEVPSGYHVGRSQTRMVVVFVRIMPVGGDAAGALLAANDIKIYPLAKAGQPVTHRYIDVSAKTLSPPILTWENKIDPHRRVRKRKKVEPATSGPLVVAAPAGVIGMFTDFFQRTFPRPLNSAS